MTAWKCFRILPVLLFPGCAHMHESSATASIEQIKAHLFAQLHCQSLNLSAEPDGNFSGSGRNDTGDFKISVSRQSERILFKGAYVEPAHGAFTGSASWNKAATSFLGFHKSHHSTNNSFSVEQSP